MSRELVEKIKALAKEIGYTNCGIATIEPFEDYRKMMGKDFHIFMGDDSLILKSLLMGGDGCVSGNASIYPELTVNG